ncbi:MAG TPA: hypothetical protein PKI80_08170, partial [Deltaproteobacteria bacterium]|nr:hypothetical protein [Deltaproteobacteria bacterium]
PHPLGGRDEGFETTYFYKDKPSISPLNASVYKARSVTITIDKSTRVPLAELSPWCLSRIKERLTFENPEFIEANRMGRSTWSIPREIRAYEIEGGLIVLPRGFARQFISILQRAGCTYKIEDQRRALPEVDFKFTGTLKDFQTEAVNAMLSRDFGTLCSPTGSGKTVMALAIIEARKQPTLIIVHSSEQGVGRDIQDHSHGRFWKNDDRAGHKARGGRHSRTGHGSDDKAVWCPEGQQLTSSPP